MRFGACHGVCTTLVYNLYAQRMRVHDGEFACKAPEDVKHGIDSQEVTTLSKRSHQTLCLLFD